eukprot:6214302-Pleurochrysis_carterae.AAC.2
MARNLGQISFKCPELVPARAAASPKATSTSSDSDSAVLGSEKCNPACGEGRSKHSSKHGRRAMADVNKFAASNTAPTRLTGDTTS